jgi:mannose/fructose/N-acetylgalactosamine-specific phosphotransferase system component IIC
VKKWLLGLLLGGFLGIFDGLSALVSSPEVAGQIVGIVIGSTIKGIIAGVMIGYFAYRVHSLALGIVFGLAVGSLLALPIAILNSAELGKPYYWQIILPGACVGLIVGYTTQRYGTARPRSLANN